MLEQILGTEAIKGGEQGSKGQEKSKLNNCAIFAQILNLINNQGEISNYPKAEENILWVKNAAQLLENSFVLKEDLFSEQVTEKNPIEAMGCLPSLMGEPIKQFYQGEVTTEEAVNEEIVKSSLDAPEKQLEIKQAGNTNGLAKVMNNLVTRIQKNSEGTVETEGTLETKNTIETKILEDKKLQVKNFFKDNAPLEISKTEQKVGTLPINQLDVEGIEEDANKPKGQVVEKGTSLEEVPKTLQAQSNNTFDLSQNNEAQRFQQFNLIRPEHKANLEQNPQVTRPPEGENPVTPRELPRYILEQFKNNFKVNSADNTSEVTIRLKPESLGKILLHLSNEGEKLSVKIFTENSLTKALVEQNMSQLRQALDEQGIKSKSIDVEVGGDNLSQHFNQQRDHQTKGNPSYLINKNKKEYALKMDEQNPLKNAARKATGLNKIEILA